MTPRPGRVALPPTHSLRATALASLRRNLPALHGAVALAGGSRGPQLPCCLPGTEALPQGEGAGVSDVDACPLANHGLIASTARSHRAHG
jgi:L-fuculose-phosphate aldolase